MRRIWIAAAALAAVLGEVGTPSAGVIASTLADTSSQLQEVVVLGEQPGPAMWRVSKDDHVLWVLGTVPVAPKGFKWKTDAVAKVLAASQVILSYPGVLPDANIGFFSGMALLPSLLGVEKLPDGGTLSQVLPAAVYARWLDERQKYLGGSKRLERLRPFIAVDKLSDAAYDKSGLTDDSEVISTVRALAKKYRVKRIDAEYHVFIKDPKALIKSFKKTMLDEGECFNYRLDDLDHSLAESAIDANAWATGDVAILQSNLAKQPADPCWQGFADISFVKDLGFTDIAMSIEEAWLKAAEQALSENSQSFAMLDMVDVLRPHGLIAGLKARGYAVLDPNAR